MSKIASEVKIGVYAIAKNESKFIKQWITSMWNDGQGADKVYVLDTGSTDSTPELFKETIKELNIPESWLELKETSYDFFRFDVARNDSLAMTEKDADNLDVLVSIDIDETMISDFWMDLRAVVALYPDFNRICYNYAWNHDENGNPKRIFWYDKVHPVRNCRWVYPVHEALIVEDPTRTGMYSLNPDKIYLHHWMDLTKPRSSYLPLLELRANENPDDINGMYYLLREYIANDRPTSALLVANLGLKAINSKEVKDTHEFYPFFIIALADVYNIWNMTDEAEYFYNKALEVDGSIRQTYISYSSFAAYHNKPRLALHLLNVMEKLVPNKYLTWHECDYNWTWRPLHIKAVALCWLGKYDEAKALFKTIERDYLVTPTDRYEAKMNNFYTDYNWLNQFLLKEDTDK